MDNKDNESSVSEQVKLVEIDYATEIAKIKEKLKLYGDQIKQFDIKKSEIEIEKNNQKNQEIDLSKIL